MTIYTIGCFAVNIIHSCNLYMLTRDIIMKTLFMMLKLLLWTLWITRFVWLLSCTTFGCQILHCNYLPLCMSCDIFSLILYIMSTLSLPDTGANKKLFPPPPARWGSPRLIFIIINICTLRLYMLTYIRLVARHITNKNINRPTGLYHFCIFLRSSKKNNSFCIKKKNKYMISSGF